MTNTMHWGKFVDSETPVTGVISQNKLNWDAIGDIICTECEKATNEINEMKFCPDCAGKGEIKDDLFTCSECGGEIDIQAAIEEIECDDHGGLVGDWKRNSDGIYEPDKENGEWAGILSSSSFNDVSVIWSKTIKKGVALCSPCAPGCATIESTGEYSCYDLPEWAKYSPEEM